MKQIDLIGYETIQKKLALVFNDKTSNSVASMCKRCYIEVILKKIGVYGQKIIKDIMR